MSNLSKLQKLLNKSYRDAFLESQVKGSIAFQIQALREQTGLNQADFGKLIGKPQSVVSRLESTEYGAVNINSLLEIAAALEIGLQVRFTDFNTILNTNVSPSAMVVDSIAETFERAVAVQSSPAIPSAMPAVPVAGTSNIVRELEGNSSWQIILLANQPQTLFQGSATLNFEKSIPTRRLPA